MVMPNLFFLHLVRKGDVRSLLEKFKRWIFLFYVKVGSVSFNISRVVVQGGSPSGGFWPGRGSPAGVGVRGSGGQTTLLRGGVRLPSGQSSFLDCWVNTLYVSAQLFLLFNRHICKH